MLKDSEDPKRGPGVSKLLLAATASVLYTAFSTVLIMLNQSLLKNGFPYPMALSSLGMGFSAAASFAACHTLGLATGKAVGWQAYVSKIMPIGFCVAVSLNYGEKLFRQLHLQFYMSDDKELTNQPPTIAGNAVYLQLSVALIQMLKAWTPILTMLGLWLVGFSTPSRRLVLAVCCIAAGTALSSAGEVNLSYTGVVYMLVAESMEAARLVMTQVLLTDMDFHPLEALMYLAPACFTWLALGSAFTELPSMLDAGAWAAVAAKPAHFAAAAAMGFAVNAAAYCVIQTASSLTLKVLGVVKNTIVVCLGVVFLKESVTFVQAVGYSASISAFVWYQKLMAQSQSSLTNPARVPAGLPQHRAP
jgi:hypothetical protein